MAPTTARQRVFAYIKQRGQLSADEIAQGLHMSAATVRHHLVVLVADGRIVTDSTVRAGRLKGRPRKLYRLSDGMRGDNLAMLSNVLLQSWGRARPVSTDTRAGVMALAKGLRERMGPIDDKLAATKRLEQLIERLNEAHYEARWEAGAQGPRVLFGRCPYAEIIDEHPFLCVMDQYLLGDVMNAEVEQLAKIQRKTGESSRCVFALRRTGRGGG